MIPYSRPKLSDFRTLSQTKQLENHTLHSGTYPYSVYMGVPPPRATEMLCSQKSLKILLWLALSDKIHFDIYLIVLREHFV